MTLFSSLQDANKLMAMFQTNYALFQADNTTCYVNLIWSKIGFKFRKFCLTNLSIKITKQYDK